MEDPDWMAKGAYQRHADNHPTIHSNRFPAWSEMGEGDRDVWRRKVGDHMDCRGGSETPDCRWNHGDTCVMGCGVKERFREQVAMDKGSAPDPSDLSTEGRKRYADSIDARLRAQFPDKPAPLNLTDRQPVLDAIIYDAGATVESRVERIMAVITQEVTRAMTKHPPITDSPHHHFAVLYEEFDELWDEVKADNIRLAREEALQVAAMAIRFVLEADLPKHKRKPSEAPKPRPNCPGCNSHPPYHRVGCPVASATELPKRPLPGPLALQE